MEQMSLLEEAAGQDNEQDVVLEAETVETVVALMASALAAVVLAVEEAGDADAR